MNQQKNISGKRIRQARLKLGLAQAELRYELLAKQGIIMPRRVLSRIEQGERPVWYPELQAFAEVLNVSPEWILGCE